MGKVDSLGGKFRQAVGKIVGFGAKPHCHAVFAVGNFSHRQNASVCGSFIFKNESQAWWEKFFALVGNFVG
ncbi:MAG: hypothetical protein IAA31_02365 [Candidatus Anaerobiospirillum merdipullorum]|uniref:Uncharacterized protein n=1 Tax=Candidatus Anaerobiospirillum merdipullorum TaxID=2838450 RepID=A0A9E2NRP3_9GAMM|nr:hypothetical protein [Candidatus Anaerobiospirillum merdipullorum]